MAKGEKKKVKGGDGAVKLDVSDLVEGGVYENYKFELCKVISITEKRVRIYNITGSYNQWYDDFSHLDLINRIR